MALPVASMVVVALPIGAQSASPSAPWEVRVTTAPNPLTAGQCAAIRAEIVDNNGYRHTTMQNGAVLNAAKYTYATSDATDFQWQNSDPATGYICTAATTGAAQTTITVTLPDGTSGTVGLANLPAGQRAPQTVFRPQAPVWRPGISPTPVAAVSQTLSTQPSGTTGAAGGAPASGTPGAVTTGPLGITGPYSALPPQSVITGALSITGPSYALAAQTVATAPLSITGPVTPMAPQTVTTGPLSVTGPGTP